MQEVISTEGNVIWVLVSDKLTKEDYAGLITKWEKIITEHGKMRLGFDMRDFHGWEPVAAWNDLKFSLSHSEQMEKVAMVGEQKWEEWVSKLSGAFVDAEVKYFDSAQLAAAQTWLRE